MIFTSFTFVVFFVLLIGLLLISRNANYRIYVLLAASYIFYGWWNVKYLALICSVSVIGWLFGYLIAVETQKIKRKIYLICSITILLLSLSYFKYFNLFLEATNHLLNTNIPFMDIVLPVGISFFTFHTLSYIIDIYHNKIPACRSLAKFLLFVSFFPQLVAGPIVRASELLPQLDQTIRFKKENILAGCQLFLGGALQKVFIADNLSQFVDDVFLSPGIYTQSTLWLAVFAYGIQIFCDFAGYSLMAIGVAKFLGFNLPKNFDMPYCAKNITEFWRRWHISLSSWLRDYLYISLGGNRKGVVRTQVNMFITMLLGGLWHGASWNFVIWGGLHGIALGLNRLWHVFLSEKVKQAIGLKGYTLLSWGITLLFVNLLWIPFRSPNFETTALFFQRLFVANDGIQWFHTPTLIILLLVSMWHIMYQYRSSILVDFPVNAYKLNAYKNIFILLFAFYVLILFSPMNASPFIYFQF